MSTLSFLFDQDGNLREEFRKYPSTAGTFHYRGMPKPDPRVPDWEKVEEAIRILSKKQPGFTTTAGAGIPFQNLQAPPVSLAELIASDNTPDPPLQEYTVILHHKDYDVDPCTRHVRGVSPADAIQLAIGEELDTYTSGWSNADLILERRKFHCDACILGHHTNLAP